MPKFKENTGFKMKGPSLYPKTHGSTERNSYTSPFKQKDRPDPTFEGTDEYRKEKDIPKTEYSARGISKTDVLFPGISKTDPKVKRSDFDKGSEQQKMFDANKKKAKKGKKTLRKSNRKLIQGKKEEFKKGKITKKQFQEAKKEIKGYTDVDAAEDHLSGLKKKGPLYQKKTKEQLLSEGFTQRDADQMMKTGATTGEQKSERKTSISNNAKILQRQRQRKTKMSNNAKVLQKQRRDQLKEGASTLAKKDK